MAAEKRSTRILPRRAGRKGPATELSHEQVSMAVRAFQERGGLIRKLPEEIAERHAKVGYRWDSVYEMPLQS